jgi:mutator protein MutT
MSADVDLQPRTAIAVAVVRQDGHVLIGQRPTGAPLAGLWEFPGGKVEPGETPQQAAARECLEESGIAVEIHGSFPKVTHDYDHARVELFFFDCRPKQPVPMPEPPYKWISVADLADYCFPAANALLIALLVNEAATMAERHDNCSGH